MSWTVRNVQAGVLTPNSLLCSLQSKVVLSQVVPQKDGWSGCCDPFALLLLWAVGRFLIWFHFRSTCKGCCSGCTKNLPMCRLCCCRFGSVVELAQQNTKDAFLMGCQEATKQGNLEEHLRILNENFLHADS